ncbi:hypothetical protein CRE_22936 [Caenorhabditis remanei]|uniref:DUF38 domain-containing protein n=1 Tax=Caenorhabditis remanei TaxID=31234 RepID=E3MW67_CAERE|nr:hypothetical protein CRE_22936 [Caenorhabditis remanei]
MPLVSNQDVLEKNPAMLRPHPRHIKKFTFKYEENYIEIFLTNGFLLKIEFIDEVVLRRCKGRRVKVTKAENELEKSTCVENELLKLFGDENHENLRIDTLRIEECGRRSAGIQILCRTWTRMAYKLKVRRLEYSVMDLDRYLTQTVESLDPSYLKSISLTHNEKYIGDCRYFDESIFKLEQWKNLESIEMMHHWSDMRTLVDHWTHFENLHLSYDVLEDQVTGAVPSIHDGVKELKEVGLVIGEGLKLKLLSNIYLKKYTINIRNINEFDVNRIQQSFEQRVDLQEEYSSFQYPNMDKWLTAYVQPDGIMFFDYKKMMARDEERRKKTDMDCDLDSEENLEVVMDGESSEDMEELADDEDSSGE